MSCLLPPILVNYPLFHSLFHDYLVFPLFLLLPFPTHFTSPLRSWQQTFRSHQPLRAGNLLPFGLNSITLCVPYSIHKQEVKTLLLREDVVKVFIFHQVHSYFAFHIRHL